MVSAISAAGGKAYALKADVSQEEQVEQLMAAVLEKCRIDVLINNAGITRDGLLMRMKTPDWQAVLDLNLSGVFLCTRAVTRTMLKQKQGDHQHHLGGGPDGQCRTGQLCRRQSWRIGFTKSTARELASRGITVNAVAPGLHRHRHDQDLAAEALLNAIPLGRYGEAG